MEESELTEYLRSALVRLKKELDEVKLLFTEGVNFIVGLNSTRPKILANSAFVPGALSQDLYLLNARSALAKETRTHPCSGVQ
jgi:hypothetical protein